MRKIKLLIIMMMLFLAGGTLASCSSINQGGTPQDIIQDHYGDEQFKISFSAEGLDKPLSDVYYSAKSIPEFPVPERVGYVFAGWYFDSFFTKPYEPEYLLVYMTDITLYAKWEKESLVNNGVYDIEFNASIKEIVMKGDLVDKYGFEDFTKRIVKDGTCIEKTDKNLYLQLQYDSGVTVDYGKAPVFEVSISVADMENKKVSISKDSIKSETDTLKTLYIDISNIELTDSIYLNVRYNNYKAGLDRFNINRASITYVVKFDITRFIGFGKSFADTSKPLDNGYYLAKTYFDSVEGGGSMMDAFNPVYSYIEAKNGHYTLIKPMMPYMYDLSGNGGIIEKDNYFDRLTTYTGMLAYYTTDVKDVEGKVDFWPEYFKAGKYNNLTYEFHADTGRYYYIMDLGTNVNQDIIFYGSVSGPMEAYFGMGANAKKIKIASDELIKVENIDYKPLEGDAYKFTNKEQYYPGKFSDLTGNTIYNSIDEYGLSTAYVNFFFGANGNINLDSKGEIFSSRITFKPTEQTNSESIADSKGKIARFNIDTEVFGYDAKNNNLCADAVRTQTFGETGRRDKYPVKNGLSLTEGKRCNIFDIYGKIVSEDIDYGKLQWEAYELNNYDINWNKKLSVSESFIFENEMAILYKYETTKGVKTTLVELSKEKSPTIKINDTSSAWSEKDTLVFETNRTYNIGDMIKFPFVDYEWYNKKGNFKGTWFVEQPDGNELDPNLDHSEMNPIRIIICDVIGDVYKVRYKGVKDEFRYNFEMTSPNMCLFYEIENDYGELVHIRFDYAGQKKADWKITDSKNILEHGLVDYDEDGVLKPVEVIKENIEPVFTIDDIINQVNKEYYFSVANENNLMLINNYIVKTNLGIINELNPRNINDELRNILSQKGLEYAYLEITYRYGNNLYTTKLTYNFKFDNKEQITKFDYHTIFTETQYTFKNVTLMDTNGTSMGSMKTNIFYYNGNDYVMNWGASEVSLSNDGNYGMSVIFNKPGKFLVEYSLELNKNEYGDWIFGQSEKENTIIKYYEEIEVIDVNDDMKVTYITDAEHPFRENIPYEIITNSDGSISYSYTITINTAKATTCLDYSSFIVKDEEYIIDGKGNKNTWRDLMYGWSDKENPDVYDTVYKAGNVIDYVVNRFNSNDIKLYAVWDKGVTVKAEYDGEIIIKRYSFRSVYYLDVIHDFNKIKAPNGERIVGWESSVFEKGSIGTDSYYELHVPTGSTIEITPIFKKIINVRYVTDYANTDIVESDSTFEADENLVVDFELGNQINKQKLQSLNDVSCNMTGRRFLYWAVDKNNDGILSPDENIKLHLNSDKLLSEWCGEDGYITLIAVYSNVGE